MNYLESSDEEEEEEEEEVEVEPKVAAKGKKKEPSVSVGWIAVGTGTGTVRLPIRWILANRRSDASSHRHQHITTFRIICAVR